MPRRYALLCLLSFLGLGGCAGNGFWRGWGHHASPAVIPEEERGKVASARLSGEATFHTVQFEVGRDRSPDAFSPLNGNSARPGVVVAAAPCPSGFASP